MNIAGSVAVILGGGASMKTVDIAAIMASSAIVVAINNSWRLAPQAHALFASDAAWWMERSPRESPLPEEFDGERFVSENRICSGPTFIRPKTIQNQGSNSALQAAWWLDDAGPKRIALFAIDLRDDELTHWHGLHGGKLKNPTAPKFARARHAWGEFAAVAKCQVVNCSERSALACFPKMTMEQALEH